MAAIQADLGRLQSDQARIEARAVAALEGAAKRIEKLAGDEAA
jgi:cell division protein ZapA